MQRWRVDNEDSEACTTEYTGKVIVVREYLPAKRESELGFDGKDLRELSVS